MIPISDKEHNHEKEVEDRLRSEITEEFKKKKWGSRRRKAGLILSGIGGIMYLLLSIYFYLARSWFELLIIPTLITGAISLMGIIIGVKKIKIGGTVILFSIPLFIVIALIFGYHPSQINWFLLVLLIPAPVPSSVFVIIGGILCLLSSDKESSERENSIKIAV